MKMIRATDLLERLLWLNLLPETTRSLKINVRVNTNGWWGNKRKIRIGQQRFSSPGHVLEWLRAHRVAILALSFDTRYDEHPEYWLPVLSLITESERAGQPYRVGFIGLL